METRMAPRPQATRTSASRSQPSSRPLSDSANDGDHNTNPCASHRACWTLLRSRGSPVFDSFLLAMYDGVAGASRCQPHPCSSPPGVATRVDLSLHHGKQLTRPLPWTLNGLDLGPKISGIAISSASARSEGGCRHVCSEENNWGRSLIKPMVMSHSSSSQMYVVSSDCECCYFVCSTMEWNDQTNMKILIVIIFVVAD